MKKYRTDAKGTFDMGDNQKNRRPSGKKAADARRAARRAAREAVLALLFETEFHGDEAPETVYLRAAEARGLGEIPEGDGTAAVDPRDEKYIRATYLGIMENLSVIDALIGRHATGWRTGRLSRVSRAVLRLGVYELAFDEKIPAPIAINEAVELSKKYDAPKARAFVNGVLNAIKDELSETGGRLPEGLTVPAVETAEAADAEVVETVETVDAAENDE